MSLPKSFVVQSKSRFPIGDNAAGHFLAALTDEVAYGLIACEDDGLIRYANRSARAELDRGRTLRLVDNIVSLADGRQAALQAALYDASHRGRRRMLTVGSAADRLMALTVPLHLQATDDEPPDTRNIGLVLIMLGRRGTCSALGVEMLAMLHGLTLAERRVLRALLDGDVPHRIALAQGVAVSTVRTHVKSIRDKVGVRSVEGLFIRAAEVPPITSALLCCERSEPVVGHRRTPDSVLATPA